MMTDISIDTVHHYVKKFRKYFKGLKRGKFNRLMFSQIDVELLVKIRTLNKVENKTIKEIMQYCQENKSVIENLNNNLGVVEEKNTEINGSKQVETKNVDILNINEVEKSNEVFPVEKLENFELMISDIKDEYKKLVENNNNMLGKTDDIKKMMNLLYTKLNSIENRQQKIIDDMSITIWDKLKGFLLKPVRVPFLWKL